MNIIRNITSRILVCLSWTVILLFFFSSAAHGQRREGPIQFFGYYQNAFEYNASQNDQNSTTFLVQQLNLIAQKDLAPRFRSFVNFEFLNTFNSRLGWGTASLKEAWVRYDKGASFKLKIGLQTPVFNYLNDIKTRSPLLPYIVRPIVYETSLEEIIRIEDFVPERAFLQAYGTLPTGNVGFEYAFFLGNSPNVNNDPDFGQTGADSTLAMLAGARVGIHWNNLDSDFSELKFGVSSTYDRVDFFSEIPGLFSDDPEEIAAMSSEFEKIPRWRFGGDFALYWKSLYLHTEFISVIHSENSERLDVDKFFFYSTLGYIRSDKLEGYVSYWRTKEFGLIRDRRINPQLLIDQVSVLNIYTLGAKYSLTPRVVVKAQYALADIDNREDFNLNIAPPGEARSTVVNNIFSVYAIAISVFF